LALSRLGNADVYNHLVCVASWNVSVGD